MQSPFSDPGFHCDPHRVYRKLRSERPVHPLSGPGEEPAFVLTRYADVEAVLVDDRFSVNRLRSRRFREGLDELPEDLQPERQRPSLLNLDPPDHTRLRRLVSRAFTPRRVEQLGPSIERRASELVEEMVEEMDAGQPVDLLEAYAGPLPARVIADLLGVPEEEHGRFRDWSDRMLRILVGARRDLADFGRARDALSAYLASITAERRRAPRDDLVSALVAAEEDDALDDDELIATCMLLLVAGHETTTNLIANGVWLLLSEPDGVSRLLADPEPAIEELLRYESPIQGIARVAIEEIALGDTVLPAGSLVSAMVGAANRDPEIFERPDALELGRTPNPHLAFGKGVHFCLGATLARLEARIALPLLFERLPALRLLESEPSWRPSAILRGLEQLRVESPRRPATTGAGAVRWKAPEEGRR